MANEKSEKETFVSPAFRVAVSVLAGLIGGVAVGMLVSWEYMPLAVWDIAAVVFLIWLWLSLHGCDADRTARLAVREDPGRATTDALLVLASVASLLAVGALLARAGSQTGSAQLLQVGLGIASVVISWMTVHAIYTLKYARIFYKNNGGVDFNETRPPSYADFAYLALTIGMTFQVSDTSLKSTEFRRIALRHALLSYLFGTVIIASTISLIGGLGK